MPEGLTATLKPTVPLPEPLAPAETVSHGALLLAVHPQPEPVVTATAPVLAADATGALLWASVNVHVAPAWVTVNVCAPIVRVPLRVAELWLAAMPKVTVPLPEPLAPAEIVSHVALLVAVHAQPATAVTATAPVLAEAATDRPVCASVEVQGAAAWVTVNVCPPIVRVPVRAVPVLAVTLKVTVPLPEPLAPAETVSQAALLVAVHGQPEPAVTATAPVAVVAGTACPAVAIDAVQAAEKPNGFESPLSLLPVGPIAETRASYTTPADGSPLRRLMKLTRILPSGPGAGLPRLTLSQGTASPVRYSARP